jgi:hypothetical protein
VVYSIHGCIHCPVVVYCIPQLWYTVYIVVYRVLVQCTVYILFLHTVYSISGCIGEKEVYVLYTLSYTVYSGVPMLYSP